jgi:hypothetical protein
VFTLEQKTFLIESYFRNGLKVNSSWIYSVQNCLEEFNAEFPNVIVDRKPSETNLSRCVKLFRETGGVYRRKTTGRPLKRTAAVIETGREIMQNAPHTSVRQYVSTQQTECLNLFIVDLFSFSFFTSFFCCFLTF